jgi:hypothetical protein
MDFHAASLYLDATDGIAVLLDDCKVSRSIAQEFPFSANRLPVAKWPGQRQLWHTLKLPFFNNL